MVAQLRDNLHVRETFGKYVDPRVVEGLINHPALTAAEGQRRRVTVLFCDMKGFTSLRQGIMTQSLVKVMNRYLSIMSEPISGTGESSTNISATASWPIGDLRSSVRRITLALHVLPRWK